MNDMNNHEAVFLRTIKQFTQYFTIGDYIPEDVRISTGSEHKVIDQIPIIVDLQLELNSITY